MKGMQFNSTLVLGLGNTLLTDEGIGVHAAQYLSHLHGDLPHTVFMDGGTLSFTLAAHIEEAHHLIVIDAADLNELPGTVHTYIDTAMDEFLNAPRKRSVHEVNLADLLYIAKSSNQLPVHRALIGIQPKVIDWGEHPSDEVNASLPTIQKTFLQLINSWHETRGTGYGTTT